jgi:flagellar biosynthetic protein FlhB
MASDEHGDKTELPTDRRRTQAREQGNIARSTDVTAAALLLAAAGAFYFVGPSSSEAMARLMRGTLTADPWLTLSQPVAIHIAWELAGALATVVLPLMGLVLLGSLAVNLFQTGFLWAPEVLELKFERINPLQGFQRLFSLSSVVRLVGSLLKISAVAWVAYLYLTSHREQFLTLPQQDAALILVTTGRSIIELSFFLALTLVALALLDYGYQYWQHEQELRMTKQELREELKEMDGNPLVRQRRREAHRKLAEGRQLGEVPTADVVITNPTHIAVAIKYDPAEMPAPIVVAKGMGEIAAQIRRIAGEHGIPIIERKPLAQALYKQVKIGHPIPLEMYEVFVEILAYVYRLTGKKAPVSPEA